MDGWFVVVVYRRVYEERVYLRTLVLLSNHLSGQSTSRNSAQPPVNRLDETTDWLPNPRSLCVFSSVPNLKDRQ